MARNEELEKQLALQQQTMESEHRIIVQEKEQALAEVIRMTWEMIDVVSSRDGLKEQQTAMETLQREKDNLEEQLASMNNDLTLAQSTVATLTASEENLTEELKKKEACLAETAENYVDLVER